jgi:hypothetical protein
MTLLLAGFSNFQPWTGKCHPSLPPLLVGPDSAGTWLESRDASVGISGQERELQGG